ncbi:hypothetical protein [Brevundimonas sp.]|uniref:hypothetical protein n=1 Tax=Brevundimonas sp. TaxID=1871086 RepID=UPI002FC5BC78
MFELTHSQIDQVSGATYDDVKTVAVGTIIGMAMGAWAGPVGILAGAASGFGHALIITQLD